MHERGTIIEGIGDEAVGVFVFCTGAVTLIATWWFSRRTMPTQRQTIHTESQGDVDQARQRLRQQNEEQSQAAPDAEVTAPPLNPTAPPREDHTCPICLGPTQFAVETNCGHVFCGNCMVTYWRSGRWTGNVRCPVCRQPVNIMLFSFNDDEHQTRTETREEVMNNINQYNRRFSGEPRELMEIVRDLPTLLRHFINDFFSVHGLIVVFRLRVLILFVIFLVYFISPLDIIPEAAFGILGFIDDLFLGFILLIYVSMMYRQYVAEQARD